MISRRQSLKYILGGSASLMGACQRETLPAPASPAPSALSVLPSVKTNDVVAKPGQALRPITPLKDVWGHNFDVGVAIKHKDRIADPVYEKEVLTHFNSVTAAFEMKAKHISSAAGVYDWSKPDSIVDFAQANSLKVRGHALLWHNSTPEWMLEGTKVQIRTKLENYITAVMERYKGKVYCWDVVNEVVMNHGNHASAPYANTNWWQAVGDKDFIDWAFNHARAVDPDVKLFLNDYNTENPIKLARLVTIVQDLLDRGIPIDGVGHQMHLELPTPTANILAALNAVDGMFAGLDQHITELDVSFYDDPGSCYYSQTNCDPDVGETAPEAMLNAQAKYYRDVFRIARSRPSVKSVTVWGVTDASTSKNTKPIERFDHPLLFDRNMEPKPCLRAISDPAAL